MVDNFERYPSSRTQPATGGFAVTPNDDEDFEVRPRALWVGVEGDITLNLPGYANIPDPTADTVTLVGVPAGTLLPISPTRILASGTTADAIVGLY